MAYYMMEKQNANSYREPTPLAAKTLDSAKREATRLQAFEGTVLEIGCDPKNWQALCRKENGKWQMIQGL